MASGAGDSDNTNTSSSNGVMAEHERAAAPGGAQGQGHAQGQGPGQLLGQQGDSAQGQATTGGTSAPEGRQQHHVTVVDGPHVVVQTDGSGGVTNGSNVTDQVGGIN